MDTRNSKTIVIAAGAVLGAVIVAALVGMASQLQAATAQQRATLQLVAAQQTAAAQQSVTARQVATAAAQQTARAAAQQAAQAAAQQTVVAGQTATVVARQDEVGMRAAVQETAVAAQAQDTAVAQQIAEAAVQQTVVAQETAEAVSQQVAAAQAVAQATAQAPHDIPLGFWNHKCVVQSTLSDETVTYTSDGTWANGMCAAALAGAGSTYIPFPVNAARPGFIQCAFIRLYGSGAWREFSNYTNPPSGDAQIAVRATSWSDAATDCSALETWTAQQNAATGN